MDENVAHSIALDVCQMAIEESAEDIVREEYELEEEDAVRVLGKIGDIARMLGEQSSALVQPRAQATTAPLPTDVGSPLPPAPCKEDG